jgi:WD40 repeat protein
MISGHFDKKIRIWDAFSDKCRMELQYNAAITSLSYNAGTAKTDSFSKVLLNFMYRETTIISVFKR